MFGPRWLACVLLIGSGTFAVAQEFAPPRPASAPTRVTTVRPAIPAPIGKPVPRPGVMPGVPTAVDPKAPSFPVLRDRRGLEKHIELVLHRNYGPYIRAVRVSLDMRHGIVAVGVQLRFFLPSAHSSLRRLLESQPELKELLLYLEVDLD